MKQETLSVVDIFDWYCGMKNFDFDEKFTKEFGFSIFDKDSHFEDENKYGSSYDSPRTHKLGLTVPLVTTNDKNFRSRLENVLKKTFEKDGGKLTILNIREDCKYKSVKKTVNEIFPDETDLVITISYNRKIDGIAKEMYSAVQEAKKP